MRSPKAVFLDKNSVFPGDLSFSMLEQVADWQWFSQASPDEVSQAIRSAEILVTNKVVIGSEVLAMAENLKLICVAATGVNNIDMAAAASRGVAVCNVNAYATASVTQHVFSMLLALNRHLVQYALAATDGSWSSSEYFCYFGKPVSELEGRTLGIIGYGELGRSVANVATCFGMHVLVAKRDDSDTRENRVDLATLLSASDVVSLHCPLTDKNFHLISEKELALMKADAILINTARGGLVDEAALLSALKDKTIGGAALDVLEQEPPAKDNPVLEYPADNLIITPHIAWVSRESRQRLLDEIASNIQAFSDGVPRNLVAV